MIQLLTTSAHETGLPDRSVHCIVTSPPYWALRKYAGEQGINWPAVSYAPMAGMPVVHVEPMTCELGLEPTPEAYIGHMVLVFRELWRVLRDDGTAWVNMGDSYAGSGGAGGDYNTGGFPGLKPKDLCGMPWRLAFALQADGWYLRSDIIWAKPNPMPESVTDRPTKAHEYVFLLAKQARYFYDADAVREKHARVWDANNGGSMANIELAQMAVDKRGAQEWNHKGDYPLPNPAGRNRRTVWTIPTQPTPCAHFATFPQALVKPCILAGTSARGVCPECGAPWERMVERPKPPSEAFNVARHVDDNNVKMSPLHRSGKASGQKMQKWLDANPPTTTGWRPTCACFGEFHTSVLPQPATVLDPFSGSGTTGKVAVSLGRRYIGIDISDEYHEDIASQRLDGLQIGLPL